MFCIPARLRPSSPPPPFSHTGRRRRLGVLKPETGNGTQGLAKTSTPVRQQAQGRSVARGINAHGRRRHGGSG